MRKREITKPIASGQNIITTESLPYPIVLYPGFSTFFAFKEAVNSPATFCFCAYEAIENYISIRNSEEIPRNAYPERMYILDSFDFPLSIVRSLMDSKIKPQNVLRALSFKEKLCHECNHVTPSYRYCHEMYGTVFRQNFGWYINKQFLEWGIHPLHKLDEHLLNKMPEELSTVFKDEEFIKVEFQMKSLGEKLTELRLANKEDSDEFRFTLRTKLDLNRVFSKYYRKIGRIVENEVRRKFGYKNIGESWTSETILYYIVKKLYPKLTILRHYRPKFLNGLELDIYIEEMNLGIEYQGVQHYRPVKHWGGEEAYLRLKKRDQLKKKLCKKLGINLIYFQYFDSLNDSMVKTKIRESLRN